MLQHGYNICVSNTCLMNEFINKEQKSVSFWCSPIDAHVYDYNVITYRVKSWRPGTLYIFYETSEIKEYVLGFY